MDVESSAVQFLAYTAAFVLGVLVSVGELSSRYDKLTLRTIHSQPFIIYVLFNGLLSLFALLLIRRLRIDVGIGPSIELTLLQSLLAVFATATLLRSALFVVRVGKQDVELGPSGFLRILRQSVDRAVDRNRAEERARLVEDLMRDISFERAYQVLPTYCLALAGDPLSPDKQEALGMQVAQLRASKMSDAMKSRVLGLILADTVGEEVLTASVRGIGGEIEPSPIPLEPSAKADNKMIASQTEQP